MSYGLKSKNYSEAEEKYRALREIAFEIAMEKFPDIEISGVTYLDAKTADKWKEIPAQQGRSNRSSWSWAKEYPSYKRKPNRFEVTLKKGGILGAICFGQISTHGSSVRMNLIESTPSRPSVLSQRALPILSHVAAVFAQAIEAKEIWVVDPDARLEELYKQEGFGNRERFHRSRVGQRRIL